MIRMLTPARAVLAITLSAGDPESVVIANVVRVVAAVSGPAAIRIAGEQRAQPVGVRQQRAQPRRGVRRHPPEQLDGRVGHAGRHLVLVEAGDRPGQPDGRAVAGGRRGVPAAAVDAQLERGDALLGHADRRRSARPRRGTPRPRSRRPRRSTNQGVTPRRSSSSTASDRRRAGDLLVAAEGQPDVLGRREVLLQQGLDRLADRDQLTLVVEGARGPRSRRRGSRRRTAGAATARPSSTGTTSRCAISTTGRSALAPAQWNSRPWVSIRVSSSRACSSGNCRSSSARKASNAAVSIRAGSR